MLRSLESPSLKSPGSLATGLLIKTANTSSESHSGQGECSQENLYCLVTFLLVCLLLLLLYISAQETQPSPTTDKTTNRAIDSEDEEEVLESDELTTPKKMKRSTIFSEGLTPFAVNSMIDKTLEKTQRIVDKIYLKEAMWRDFKDVGYDSFKIHMLHLYREAGLSGIERLNTSSVYPQGRIVFVNVTMVWRDIQLWGEQRFFTRPGANNVVCELSLGTMPLMLSISGPEAGQVSLVSFGEPEVDKAKCIGFRWWSVGRDLTVPPKLLHDMTIFMKDMLAQHMNRYLKGTFEPHFAAALKEGKAKNELE